MITQGGNYLNGPSSIEKANYGLDIDDDDGLDIEEIKKENALGQSLRLVWTQKIECQDWRLVTV